MLTASPDRRRRLADGVLVDASIRARVLGIRLLTIDAAIVLAPADITAQSPGLAPPQSPGAVPPARRSGVRPRRSGAAGLSLAEAVRNIDEGAQLLAEVRRNGS